MTTIKKFVIYGERCSGTNFLENVIKTNFGLELSNAESTNAESTNAESTNAESTNAESNREYSFKHFFGFDKFNKPNDDILFIGIIRNPIYWLNSFSIELHQIPEENRTLENFLFNKFYSIDRENKIIMDDVNYITKDFYNNIFELRKLKNFYLINIMKHKVKNYILINYESLLFNYDYTLDFIKNKFNLSKKFPEYVEIKKYKDSNKRIFLNQKEILFKPEMVDLIWDNLHIEQENRLGYFKDDSNERFKSQENIKFITSK
jgi:hypothetical protein